MKNRYPLFLLFLLFGFIFSACGGGERGDGSGGVDDDSTGSSNGITIRVSVKSDGTQGSGSSNSPSISSDGTKTAFVSAASNLVDGDLNGATDIFIRDLTAETTTLVSVKSDGTQGSGSSNSPSISSDGTKTAFVSAASNLVDGDLNGATDIFIRDLTAETTTLVSVKSDGTQGSGSSDSPSISSNGSHISFESSAATLVDGDTNGLSDIFIHTP